MLLGGRWNPDHAAMVLELRCRFHAFDGLEPVAETAELHLRGVTGVEQWHREPLRELSDTSSRLPAPPPASPLEPWPYLEECDIGEVVLERAGWRPGRAVGAQVLHRGRGEDEPAGGHRLVVGLLHPEFMDHQVWLVVDHGGHRVMVGGEELDLAAWLSEYQAWIRRAAAG